MGGVEIESAASLPKVSKANFGDINSPIMLQNIGEINKEYTHSKKELDEEKKRDKEHEINNSICGEYGGHNSRFWFFMFGVLFVSILMFITLYYGIGSPAFLTPAVLNSGEPLPEVESNETFFALMIGFIVFFFITGFVEYHHYKNENGRNFRYVTLFCMIMVWAFSLWWAVIYFPENSRRDATIRLLFALFFIFVWIYIAFYKTVFKFSNWSYLLFIPLLWLVLVLAFNIDNFSYEKCKCKRNCRGTCKRNYRRRLN